MFSYAASNSKVLMQVA